MNQNTFDCFELRGKSILVTGATRGIGKGVALKLGQAGANVGVTYTGSTEKSLQSANEVCAEIENLGAKAKAFRLNVSDETNVSEVVDAFSKDFGSIWGLVNNAGMTVDQLMLRYKMEDFDKVMNTNVKGSFLVTKACLRSMMKNGGGSVVTMSSVVGEMGNAGQSVYAASKAALMGMTMSLAREYGSKNVRFNCIAPGFIETDMTDALKDDQKEALLKNVPLAKLGQVDDIAWGCLYLLSHASKYVTGQTLSINGGLYM